MFNLDIEKKRLFLTLKCKEYLTSKDSNIFIDLMKEFLIPIDSNRIGDYMISSYDPNRVSISVVDLKERVIYCSSYNSDNKGIVGCNLVIETVTENDKVVNTYNGKNKKILNEELSVIQDDYEIKVKKDQSNKTSIIYSDVMSRNCFDYRNIPIFTTEYSREFIDGVLVENEHLCVHSNGNNPYRKFEKLNEDISYLKNNIIYSVNDSCVYGNNVRGICFHNGNVNDSIKDKYLNNVFNSDSFYDEFDEEPKSVMIFDCDDDNDLVTVKVIKRDDLIEVCCEKTCSSKNEFSKKYFYFPVLSYGKITSNEIKLLCNDLKEKYDDFLVESICNRLEKFGEVISEDKSLEKEIDLINKDFYNYSMKVIRNIFSKDKEEYFRYMSDKYHSLVDDIRLPKEPVKILSKKV